MRKAIAAAIAVALFALMCAGCYARTKYDEKTLVRAEYSGAEGMAAFPLAYTRAFDFSECAVFDEVRCDERTEEEYIRSRLERYDAERDGDYEAYETKVKNYCNTPVKKGEFSAQSGEAFCEYIVKNGVFTWKDSYKTDKTMYDFGGFHVCFYFSDGTEKSTYFYAEYPRNYKKIEAAFESYLGFSLKVSYSDF